MSTSASTINVNATGESGEPLVAEARELAEILSHSEAARTATLLRSLARTLEFRIMQIKEMQRQFEIQAVLDEANKKAGQNALPFAADLVRAHSKDEIDFLDWPHVDDPFQFGVIISESEFAEGIAQRIQRWLVRAGVAR